MNFKFLTWATSVAVLIFLLNGCVKQPTLSEKTVDNRPAISFKLQNGGIPGANYLVYVDNLDMGRMDRYLAGKNALRVLSGSHLIRVEKQGQKLFEETLYLGDGAIREILVP